MKKIAFWLNELCERGTATAVYDYAYFNQTLLGNKSYVLYEKNNINNNNKVIQKFDKDFITEGLECFADIDAYLIKHNIKILYIIKAGANDQKISKIAKTFVHCVFDATDPHGDVYASISNSVNGYQSHIPVLPHIVHLPDHNEDLREVLNIPKDAIVYGRYGGKHQFDIIGVHQVIYNVAMNNPHIYFLFANTQVFCPPIKNIIHIDTIIDLNEKRKFINTCDAMLWARSDGETFGLAIGEFSICNKPIIAYKHHSITSDFHIKTLKDNALWFKTSEELIYILITFNKDKNKQKDWNMYREYTPEKVMDIFNELVVNM